MPKCCGVGFSLRFDLKLHELQTMLVVPDGLVFSNTWRILPLNLCDIHAPDRVYITRHHVQARVENTIYSQYKILREKCMAAGVFDV
jgi:hypothetical protein